jgi:hypothetical protein
MSPGEAIAYGDYLHAYPARRARDTMASILSLFMNCRAYTAPRALDSANRLALAHAADWQFGRSRRLRGAYGPIILRTKGLAFESPRVYQFPLRSSLA